MKEVGEQLTRSQEEVQEKMVVAMERICRTMRAEFTNEINAVRESVNAKHEELLALLRDVKK